MAHLLQVQFMWYEHFWQVSVLQNGDEYMAWSRRHIPWNFGRVCYNQWGMPYKTYILKHWPDYRSLEREQVNAVKPKPVQLF